MCMDAAYIHKLECEAADLAQRVEALEAEASALRVNFKARCAELEALNTDLVRWGAADSRDALLAENAALKAAARASLSAPPSTHAEFLANCALEALL